jgi:putative ABC transport system substrate-binding protein
VQHGILFEVIQQLRFNLHHRPAGTTLALKSFFRKGRQYIGHQPSMKMQDLRSANRKSRIENLNWAGLLTLILLLGYVGMAEAQQPKKSWRIGFISSMSPVAYAHLYSAFQQGLGDLGYVDGQNVIIKARWAEGNTERLPELAAELVGEKVDIIVSTGGTLTALATKAATTHIPVVFTAGGDLIRVGLISSLARPGGNLTGLNLLTTELGIKRLELLKESFPKIRRVAILGNPTNPNHAMQVNETQAAAKQLGLQVQVLEARNLNEVETAFSKLSEKSVSALLMLPDSMLNAHRERSAELATKSRVPAIFEFKEFVEAGGLMSYGTNIVAVYRRVAVYVDKIVKGAKPSDLPVEQPTNFEFVINLKTANQMGVTIPPNVLSRADKVIR